MKQLPLAALIAVGIFGLSVQAQSVSISPTITISISPIAQSVTLGPISPCTASGLNLSCTFSGPNDANAPVATVSITTNPAGQNFTGTMTLGGANGSSFAWASPASACTVSGATVTCSNVSSSAPLATIAIGASNLAAGNYATTETVSP